MASRSFKPASYLASAAQQAPNRSPRPSFTRSSSNSSTVSTKSEDSIVANFRGLSTADGKEKGNGRSESMGPPRSITPGMLYLHNAVVPHLVFAALPRVVRVCPPRGSGAHGLLKLDRSFIAQEQTPRPLDPSPKWNFWWALVGSGGLLMHRGREWRSATPPRNATYAAPQSPTGPFNVAPAIPTIGSHAPGTAPDRKRKTKRKRTERMRERSRMG